MVEAELVSAIIGLESLKILLGFLLFLIILVIICSALSTDKRKSQDYRKLLCDLYVAGKTKLLAKEDNIDLDEEFKEFKKWEKKQRASNPNKDLDNVIEGELKERVSDETVAKVIDNKSKK